MPKPYPDEKKSNYIPRCISYMHKEGKYKNSAQIAAICFSMWENKDKKKNEELDMRFDRLLGEDDGGGLTSGGGEIGSGATTTSSIDETPFKKSLKKAKKKSKKKPKKEEDKEEEKQPPIYSRLGVN